MFTIDEIGNIHVSRGDSVGLSTQPFIEADDGIAAIPIEGDNCVIFTVKSRYSGRTIIKRILTEEDVVDSALSLQITTDETDIEPYGYDPCQCINIIRFLNKIAKDFLRKLPIFPQRSFIGF